MVGNHDRYNLYIGDNATGFQIPISNPEAFLSDAEYERLVKETEVEITIKVRIVAVGDESPDRAEEVSKSAARFETNDFSESVDARLQSLEDRIKKIEEIHVPQALPR